jgi:hypothetical protein
MGTARPVSVARPAGRPPLFTRSGRSGGPPEPTAKRDGTWLTIVTIIVQQTLQLDLGHDAVGSVQKDALEWMS